MRQAPKDTAEPRNTRPQAPRDYPSTTDESSTHQLKSVTTITVLIHHIILDKKFTQYDFWEVLDKYRAEPFFIVTKILTTEGHNILHEIIDKGRLSYLSVIVQRGWWKILSQQKVPATSASDYAGKTPKYVAEMKRAKKPLQEFISMNEWEDSLSPLMKAIRSGDTARANQILNLSGEEVFYCDQNGGNALYWAVIAGDTDFFIKLIESGLDPSLRTKKQENLLHVACSIGQKNMIETIVKHCSFDPWRKDGYHKTPMDRVAENGDIDTLKTLIKCGICPKPSAPSTGAFLGRKLFVCYCIETLEMEVDSKDLYNRTSLHRAVEGNKIEITKYLINKGADISLLTCNKRNILHIVSDSGSDELLDFIITLLKEKNMLAEMISKPDRLSGVELCFLIRGRDKGRDAWHYVEVVRTKVPIFLKNTKSGNVDVASYGEVIKSGWGVNPSQDDIDEIEELFKTKKLDESADADMTPLHIAMFKGHHTMAQKLITNGANVNARDSYGNTPLMIAAAKGDAGSVNLLEQHGAIYNLINDRGESAAEIADINEHDDVVNMLKGRENDKVVEMAIVILVCQNTEIVVNMLKGRENDKVVETFVQGNLGSLERNLAREKLESVRKHGGDVRRHIIDTLRDFRCDINQILMEIGSGPVVESTDAD